MVFGVIYLWECIIKRSFCISTMGGDYFDHALEPR